MKRGQYWVGKKRGQQTKKWRNNISKGLLKAYQEGRRTNEYKSFRENNPNKGKFGKDHPRYKENKKHPFHKLIRETYKYKDWRKTIFERDSYTCVLCGKSGYVEADHHPRRFIDIINEFGIDTLDKAINCEPLWDVTNGRTLCKKCHLKTLSWGRQRIRY